MYIYGRGTLFIFIRRTPLGLPYILKLLKYKKTYEYTFLFLLVNVYFQILSIREKEIFSSLCSTVIF